MAAGQTHDRITLICLPIVTVLSLLITRSAELTLWIAGSFLFGGGMFGPDLDIHSNQSIRWGWLAWIWQPYRQAIPHRSMLSHGPIIGTLIRLGYLGLWLLLGWLIVQAVYQLLGVPTWNEKQIWRSIQQFINSHGLTLAAIFVGLELGAMSHYSADTISSWYKKRFKKRPSRRKE
jgi:uncharacterized metal-binding protein